jgi:hypothetical protein
MVEKVTQKDTVIAIIIRSKFKTEGIEFFTPDHFSQQLGYMSRPKGYAIEPHLHRVVERTVTLTQEVLFVKSGSVKILLYDNDHVFVAERILEPGDIILLASGGHALEMLENSELIEVKQGPYACDEDKVRFTPSKKNEVKSPIDLNQ